MPLRHRFIDDHLAAALDAGAEQVVLLGAGYDTRAYRFADQLAGRPVFEVDLAPISRAKAATIAKHADTFPDANVVRVEIDFETQALDRRPRRRPASRSAADVLHLGGRADVPDPRCRQGDARRGVSDQRRRLADRPRHVVPRRRSRVRWARPAASSPRALSLIGEPVTFGVHPEEMDHFLGRHGFTIIDLALARELQDRYAPGERALVDDSMYVLAAERLP